MPKLLHPGKSIAETGKERETDFACIWAKFGHSFSSNCSPGELIAEACPWCGGAKLYLNAKTGQYDCKSGSCQAKGNLTTFLTWQFNYFLDRTTADHYKDLMLYRGIHSQTLKAHGLAYDEAGQCWLLPYRNEQGNIVNVEQYYPLQPKPNKFHLPGLSTALYGFDRLMKADKGKPVLLCEGVFDAIVVDYNIGATNRAKYVIVASPGTNFKEVWAEHFKGRKVRVLFDNDEAGEKGAERAGKLLIAAGAEQVKILKWPEEYHGWVKDMSDLLGRCRLEYEDPYDGRLFKWRNPIKAAGEGAARGGPGRPDERIGASCRDANDPRWWRHNKQLLRHSRQRRT
jgi:hypothetical protein